MHLGQFSCGCLGLTLAAAVACGGGGDPNAADHDMNAMGGHEMTAPTEATPVDGTILGGGTATEVHPGDAGSPHVKVNWVVNGAHISIAYGRPYLKDRIVGESVEPMPDRVWRLGADEATTLVTDTDLMLGSAHVPAGEYTLWAAHMNDEFHLIVNSETGQWGTSYNSDNDLAHAAMEIGELATPAEQLTLKIENGKLGFDWGTMTATVPLMVH
jgi:hypothetical protein